MAMDGSNVQTDQSCTVRFVTKLPEAVPDQALSVPSILSTDGLNDLVNHLLGQDPPVDYDFLIDGEFLRSSLADYVGAGGRSFESVLTLEYTHWHPAPEPESALPHPDWIACVAIAGPLIFTGCYDNFLRQWSSGSERQAAGHTGPVKCLAASSSTIITGSKDRTVRLWSLEGFAPEAVGALHTDSVECVAICPSQSALFASGSWDRTIRIWGRGDAAAAPVTKKPRKSKAAKITETALLQKSCLNNVHSQAVTGLCWPEPGTIYSVSWDRSLRRIDANESSAVQTWTLPDAAQSASYNQGANVVAIGHADRALRLYDPRQAGAAVKTLRGHLAWVSDVSWSPSAPTMLVSSSYDCTLKIWDIRSSTSLHTLKADDGDGNAKTLAVDWGSDGVISCGGTDGKLRLHRAK